MRIGDARELSEAPVSLPYGRRGPGSLSPCLVAWSALLGSACTSRRRCGQEGHGSAYGLGRVGMGLEAKAFFLESRSGASRKRRQVPEGSKLSLASRDGKHRS